MEANSIFAPRPQGWVERSSRVYIPSDAEVVAWQRRIRENNGLSHPVGGGAGQQFGGAFQPFAQLNATVINAVTTETALHPSLSIPRDYLKAGSQFRITVWGAYNSSASTIPTQTYRLRLGTNGSTGTVGNDTAVCATPALTATASQVNASFYQQWMLTCFTPSGQGLTVAEVGMGLHIFGLSTATTVTPVLAPQSAPATVAVASNAALYLTATCTLSSTTAGNSEVVWSYLLEDVGP